MIGARDTIRVGSMAAAAAGTSKTDEPCDVLSQ